MQHGCKNKELSLALRDCFWRTMPFQASGAPQLPTARQARPRRPPAPRIGTSRRILDSIRRGTVQLALWQRTPTEGLIAALTEWAQREPAARCGPWARYAAAHSLIRLSI